MLMNTSSGQLISFSALLESSRAYVRDAGLLSGEHCTDPLPPLTLDALPITPYENATAEVSF